MELLEPYLNLSDSADQSIKLCTPDIINRSSRYCSVLCKLVHAFYDYNQESSTRKTYPPMLGVKSAYELSPEDEA